jgi:hypothetical protein
VVSETCYRVIRFQKHSTEQSCSHSRNKAGGPVSRACGAGWLVGVGSAPWLWVPSPVLVGPARTVAASRFLTNLFRDTNCHVPQQGVPTLNDQEKQTPEKTTPKALPTKTGRAETTNETPRPRSDSYEARSTGRLDHREISDSHDPGSGWLTHCTHQL